MHWIRQRVERATKMLHHGLKAETHAEDWKVSPHGSVDRGRGVEVARASWSGRQNKQVGAERIQIHFREAGAERDDLGAGLPEVVCQGVYKGILMVDQHDLL